MKFQGLLLTVLSLKILCLTCFTVVLHDVASQPRERMPIADWLSEKTWSLVEIFPLLITLLYIFSIAIWIATNSPRRMDPHLHAPAPHGPGLPKHDLSVKQTVVSVLQLPIISVRRFLDNLSCSVVLDLDDPKVSQYSGFFLLGCRESKKLSSCSKLCTGQPRYNAHVRVHKFRLRYRRIA